MSDLMSVRLHLKGVRVLGAMRVGRRTGLPGSELRVPVG